MAVRYGSGAVNGKRQQDGLEICIMAMLSRWVSQVVSSCSCSHTPRQAAISILSF